MREILRNKKYVLSAICLIVYLVVINRASYLSRYVDLILIASFVIIYRPINYYSSGKFWNFMFLCCFYVFLGIVNRNNYYDILTDFIMLSPICLVVCRSPEFEKDYISNQFIGIKILTPIFLILYCVIFAYMDYSWLGVEDVRFAYNEDVHLYLFAPLIPLSFIPVFISYNKIKGPIWLCISIWLGALAYMHMGFITATKSYVLMIVIILVLRLFFNDSRKSRLIYLLALVLGCVVIVNLVESMMGGMIEPFIEKFKSGNESNTERITESLKYISQCSPIEWIIGKGFGGIKTFHGEAFIGGEEMIHIGITHVFMKGGLLLVGLIYYPLLYIVFKDYKEKHYEFVIMALFFLFSDFTHTWFINFVHSIFYWYLVYYRYYDRPFGVII